jgi:RNA polymerase sigma-70 factor, ECF subfamily
VLVEYYDPRKPSTSRSEATSLTLIERVKSQDPAAWQRLVDLYSPLVFSWGRRSGLSGEDSGDLVQDVFLEVVANMARFRRDRAGDTFRGWLRVIARNKIRLRFRKEAERPQAAGGTAAQIRVQDLVDGRGGESDSIPPDEGDEWSDLLQWGLEVVRSEFEARTWQAFWLTVVEQRSSADVGQELQMTPAAVRQAKHKVLRRLRCELEGLPD